MAVADALVALDPHVRITALGTARGLENRLVPERGYLLRLVTPVPLPRTLNADLLRLPWRVRTSIKQTRAVLDDVAADAVVGGRSRPLSRDYGQVSDVIRTTTSAVLARTKSPEDGVAEIGSRLGRVMR